MIIGEAELRAMLKEWQDRIVVLEDAVTDLTERLVVLEGAQ